MIEIDAERLARNPDFQLRDFGAFVPVVSFRRKSLSERTRHPVNVTTVGVGPVVMPSNGSGSSAATGSAAARGFCSVAGAGAGCARSGAGVDDASARAVDCSLLGVVL